jgi:multiple sugar transport system permease protein
MQFPLRAQPPARRSGARRRDAPLAWLLITPAMIGFAFFIAYPTLRGTYLAFTNYDVLNSPQWTGLQNLDAMLHDSGFWNSVKVTIYFVALVVIIGTFFSLLTAVILHRLTASTVIRGLIILPFLVSGVVAGTVWEWMLDPELGIVNVALTRVIGHPILFLGSPSLAIPSIAMISVWKAMGYNAIIIFAGLQTIPPTIYEAGRLDGASEIQMFRRLTLPLLRPIMALVVVLSVIGAFQVFDIVNVTTKGGPANASEVLQERIYQTAFSGNLNFGYAFTMSLGLFAILIGITFLQVRMLRAGDSDLG